MSTHTFPHTLFAGIDIGGQTHTVAFGDERGNVLHEFEINHTHAGFEAFFTTLQHYSKIHQATPVSLWKDTTDGQDHLIR